MKGHPAVQQFARERRTISCGNREIAVLCSRPIVREQDAGVLLIHEAFGVTESVLRLAGLIAAAGFVVWLPVLRTIGQAGEPANRRRSSIFACSISVYGGSLMTVRTRWRRISL